MGYLKNFFKNSLLPKYLIIIFAAVILYSCDDDKDDNLVYMVEIANGDTVKLNDEITLNYKTNFWCDGLDGYAQGTVTLLDDTHIEINTKELPDGKELFTLDHVGIQGFTISDHSLELCDLRRGFILKTRAVNSYNDKPKAFYKFVIEPYTVDKVKYLRIYYQKL